MENSVAAGSFGQKCKDIASNLRVDRPTVFWNFTRFRETGLHGVEEEPSVQKNLQKTCHRHRGDDFVHSVV